MSDDETSLNDLEELGADMNLDEDIE